MPSLIKPEKLVAIVDNRPLLLITDYDGTLVPIAPTPGEAAPPAELIKLLRKLCGLHDVRAAVVSGRPLARLEEWLPVQSLYLAGTHGAEIKEPGGERVELVNRAAVQEELAPLVRRARELIRGKEGFLLEDKGVSAALHYRLADPEQARAVTSCFRSAVLEMLPGAYTLMKGKKVLEVRPGNLHKGRAVEWLLGRFPGHTVIYLGDDVTDEDAFRAVLGRGTGVLVSETDRPSRALYRLKGPVEVTRFLCLIIK